MKVYEAENIRNIALLGHGATGKTTLTEAALYTSGAVGRMGKIETGNTKSDYLEDETSRQISISTSLMGTRISSYLYFIEFSSEKLQIKGQGESGVVIRYVVETPSKRLILFLFCRSIIRLLMRVSGKSFRVNNGQSYQLMSVKVQLMGFWRSLPIWKMKPLLTVRHTSVFSDRKR